MDDRITRSGRIIASLKRPLSAQELLHAAVTVAVILAVLEIGDRLGSWWLGPAILFAAVAVVELYRLLQQGRSRV